MRAEERVLEHALRRAFGARDSVDVAAAVVARLRARNGTAGSMPAAAPVELPSARRTSSHARRVMVAAMALAAIGTIGWFAWWPRGTVVATATRTVPIARGGGAGRTEIDASVRAGDVVVIGDGPEVELRTSGGALLRPQPRTVLAFPSATRCRLRVGALTVASGADAVVLETSPASLRIAESSVLEARATAVSYPSSAPELFEEIAKDMTPGSILFPVTLTVTLVSGAASLTTTNSTRELQVGAAVVVEDPAPPPAPSSEDDLAREVGAWEIELVETDPATGARERFRGRESCVFGPGKHWIESHIGFAKPGAGVVELAIILGLDQKRGVWHGSLVDSFGGQMALLEGAAASDGGERVLAMRSFDGEPLGARMRTTWNGSDERRTVFETQRDGGWRVVREVVHHRRATEKPSAEGQSERANVAAAQIKVKEIHDLVLRYMGQNDGRIPTWRDLMTPDARGHKFIEAGQAERDPWGHLYVIGRDPENEKKPLVTSWGPDEQEGTADDIVDKSVARAVEKK